MSTVTNTQYKHMINNSHVSTVTGLKMYTGSPDPPTPSTGIALLQKITRITKDNPIIHEGN